jgi:hypothetical protein
VVRHSASIFPTIRIIKRGSVPGLFRLEGFQGVVEEDVEVLAAHVIVSLAQPS